MRAGRYRRAVAQRKERFAPTRRVVRERQARGFAAIVGTWGGSE